MTVGVWIYLLCCLSTLRRRHEVSTTSRGPIAHCRSAEGLSGSGAPRLRSSRKSISPMRSESERGETLDNNIEPAKLAAEIDATDKLL